MKLITALAAILLVAGCATYDGRLLVANKSSAADVEAQMGVPAERLDLANGEKAWYFLRGKQTYAVVLGADGLMRSVEPRLSKASIAKLIPGQSTAKQVREILGPPVRIVRMDRQQRDSWEYFFRHYEEYRVLWVQLSYDGVMQEALDMLDWGSYAPSGPGKD